MTVPLKDSLFSPVFNIHAKTSNGQIFICGLASGLLIGLICADTSMIISDSLHLSARNFLILSMAISVVSVVCFCQHFSETRKTARWQLNSEC